MEFPISATEIQLSLFSRFFGSKFLVVPNYTPKGWFECDVLVVLESGTTREFEIKRSISDFRADRKKKHGKRYRSTPRGVEIFEDTTTKLEQLEAGQGPHEFYYAIPQELQDVVLKEAPEWCGIIVFSGDLHSRKRYIHSRFVRRAKKLHKNPPKPEVIEAARRVFYWRYWNLLKSYVERKYLHPGARK